MLSTRFHFVFSLLYAGMMCTPASAFDNESLPSVEIHLEALDLLRNEHHAAPAHTHAASTTTPAHIPFKPKDHTAAPAVKKEPAKQKAAHPVTKSKTPKQIAASKAVATTTEAMPEQPSLKSHPTKRAAPLVSMPATPAPTPTPTPNRKVAPEVKPVLGLTHPASSHPMSPSAPSEVPPAAPVVPSLPTIATPVKQPEAVTLHPATKDVVAPAVTPLQQPAATVPALTPEVDHAAPPLPDLPDLPNLPNLPSIAPKDTKTSAVQPASERASNSRLAYAKGDTALTPAHKNQLKSLVAELVKAPDAKTKVIAYTAAAATEEEASKGRRSALQRLISIRKYLIAEGVQPTQITIQALGDSAANQGNSQEAIDFEILPKMVSK